MLALTALVNAEPITRAQEARVQALQWFLSESTWNVQAVNTRRLERLRAADWEDAEHPGRWIPVERGFRDGRREIWWVREIEAGPCGPAKGQRVVVATIVPTTLPARRVPSALQTIPVPRWISPRSCGCSAYGIGSRQGTSR